MNQLIIYGATGYTGRMAARHAVAAGLPVLLAGRSPGRLAELSQSLKADYRIFDLEDEAGVDDALSGAAAVLNCAGPYMRTAESLMRAALRRGVHYLDIAAELDSYRLAETLDEDARSAGVMLLPGSGGSVAMLGCLTGHTAVRVQNPHKIAVALHISGSMSRGSAISARENLTTETLVRQDGLFIRRSDSTLQDFDFGKGEVACFPVTLPDLITIGRTTGIKNVEAFAHVSGSAFPEGDPTDLPDDPTEVERDANRYRAVAEVTGADGTVARSILDTVNGYSFTPLAAAEAARRVLAGEVRPGFQTPAGLFGNAFAETIADTRISDL